MLIGAGDGIHFGSNLVEKAIPVLGSACAGACGVQIGMGSIL
jgi:hypothetical protein